MILMVTVFCYLTIWLVLAGLFYHFTVWLDVDIAKMYKHWH